MYPAYKLNKQGDNIQLWHTPFLWNQSVVSCPILTVVSWFTYRFLRRQVRCFHLLKNYPQFVVIHTVKDLFLVIKAEVDVSLELSCFFDDPVDVGNLTSGSSAFSKSSLNIWKFTVLILLKPDLENFDHYFASMWDECNCGVVWTFFGIAFLWDWNENWSYCQYLLLNRTERREILAENDSAVTAWVWHSAAMMDPQLLHFGAEHL